MAISLKDLKKSTSNEAPRYIVYGPAGMGKTSLAAEFPSPIFLQTEEGTPAGVEFDTFGKIDTLETFTQALDAILNEDHAYATVVIDSLDKLEPIFWAHLCMENGWKSIEAPGYGRGYREADYYWRRLVSRLDEIRRHKQMQIVMIAHSEVERVDEPGQPSYSKHMLRVHRLARATVEDWSDCILFLNQDIVIESEDAGFKKTRNRADGAGARFVHCQPHPAYTAKTRYEMPARFMYVRGQGWEEIRKAVASGKATGRNRKEAA